MIENALRSVGLATGDGFDSTYAVQWWLTRERLELEVPGEKQKIIAPMRTACGRATPEKSEKEGPWLFAIPGNHDWYDNLAAFTHVFITKKTFCMWHAPQRRSYFAIALPHDWWLLGPDVQLSSEIDDVRMEFFRAVGEK